MFATLMQARTAFSHLNPAEVRREAARTVRVGLIAAAADRYVAMEETLAPAVARPDERVHAMSAMFRGGDASAPADVDLVLYDEGIPVPDDAYVLYRDNLAATLAAILHDHEAFALPLARQFPGLRTHIVDRLVQSIARENTIFAFATALPDVVPNLIEIPWAFGEWATDTAFLTANQIRMAFLISAACGKEAGFGSQKGQILTIAASAFGWRAIARELAGKIPLGGGLIAKAAIAYAGTYVVGKSLELLYRDRMEFRHEEKRGMYTAALERGREIARSLTQPRS